MACQRQFHVLLKADCYRKVTGPCQMEALVVGASGRLSAPKYGAAT